MTPLCHTGVQKLHAHWKYHLALEFIQIRSAAWHHLACYSKATGSPQRRCLPWRYHRVTWITRSSLWCYSHLPSSDICIAQNNTCTFFIVTTSVVKDVTICVSTCAALFWRYSLPHRFKILLMVPVPRVTPVIHALSTCPRPSPGSLTMSCNISPEIWRSIVGPL